MAFRLLVVNADHDGLRAAEQALVSAGYLVTCASSFRQARQGLQIAPPDLLVTDLRLGAYNGVHLVARAHTECPSMPAIVMDVHYDQMLESEAENAGAVYVGEPLGPGPLVALVRKLEKESAPHSAERRFPRKRASLPVCVAGVDARLVDVSYSGLRLELSGVPNGRPRVATVDILTVGAVPVRLIWVKGAGTLSVWWCGVEVAAADRQTTIAWRSFVDSLN